MSFPIPVPSLNVVVGSLSFWQVLFTYQGWKPDRHSFMCSVSWASISGECHPSQGQPTADVLQIDGSHWSRTRGRWFHRRKPLPWPLSSMLSHHRTGYRHNYGAHSTLLCEMTVNPTRRSICPLTVLVFNSAGRMMTIWALGGKEIMPPTRLRRSYPLTHSHQSWIFFFFTRGIF